MGLNKRRHKEYGHFVQLIDQMTTSEAWRQLSLKAIWVYIEIRKKYRGNNIDNLSLTYKEVAYKLSSATYSKALKELIQSGFIKIIRPGGLYRSCTIFGLSDEWKNKK